MVATQRKLYFGGGSQGPQHFATLDVFDVSGYWTSFNLTEPRRLILSGSYGSRVVFIGGTGPDNTQRNIVEVFNEETFELTSAPLPPADFNRLIVGENKAIFWGRNTPAYRLDLTTLDVVLVRDPPTNYVFGTSNGTHAFIITELIGGLDIIDLETLHSTSLTINHGGMFQATYSNDYVYFIGTNSVTLYGTARGNTIIYNFQVGRVFRRLAVVVDQVIYLFGTGFSAINPFSGYEIHHDLPQNVNPFASVAADGLIALALNTGGFFSLNTRLMFQPLPTGTDTTPSFVARDTIFFIRQPNISTYDFNARRLTVHPYEGVPNAISSLSRAED